MPHSTALLVLIGPSASGKSTLARTLAAQGMLRLLPTWTTRPRRPDEDGDTAEHRFVTDPAFDRLSARQAFLLEGRHPGLPYRYGLPRLDDAPGIATVILRARHVATLAAATGRAPVVYQICAPVEDVAARLAARGTSGPERALRLAGHRAECAAGARLSRRTFVNDAAITDLVGAVSRAVTTDFASEVSHV